MGEPAFTPQEARALSRQMSERIREAAGFAPTREAQQERDQEGRFTPQPTTGQGLDGGARGAAEQDEAAPESGPDSAGNRWLRSAAGIGGN
jgi:hypothetical protein